MEGGFCGNTQTRRFRILIRGWIGDYDTFLSVLTIPGGAVQSQWFAVNRTFLSREFMPIEFRLSGRNLIARLELSLAKKSKKSFSLLRNISSVLTPPSATNSIVIIKVSTIDYRGRWATMRGSISTSNRRGNASLFTRFFKSRRLERRGDPGRSSIIGRPRRFEGSCIVSRRLRRSPQFSIVPITLRTIGYLTGIGLVKYHFNAD